MMNMVTQRIHYYNNLLFRNVNISLEQPGSLCQKNQLMRNNQNHQLITGHDSHKCDLLVCWVRERLNRDTQFYTNIFIRRKIPWHWTFNRPHTSNIMIAGFVHWNSNFCNGFSVSATMEMLGVKMVYQTGKNTCTKKRTLISQSLS